MLICSDVNIVYLRHFDFRFVECSASPVAVTIQMYHTWLVYMSVGLFRSKKRLLTVLSVAKNLLSFYHAGTRPRRMMSITFSRYWLFIWWSLFPFSGHSFVDFPNRSRTKPWVYTWSLQTPFEQGWRKSRTFTVFYVPMVVTSSLGKLSSLAANAEILS